MFKLFKKAEVTNSDDLSKVMVELSDGSAVSIGEMVNSVEEKLKAEELKDACHNEDILEKVVKVNGEDMKVSDLIKAFEDKCSNADDEEKKPEAEEAEEKKDADDEPKEEPKSEEAKEDKENEVKDKRELIRQIMAIAGEAGASEEQVRTIAQKCEELAYDKDEAQKEGSDEEPKDEPKDEPKEDKKNSKELLEAEEKANLKEFQGQVVDTMSRRLARGQERYGSAK